MKPTNVLNLLVAVVACAAILLTSNPSLAASPGVEFPGKTCFATSPDGRYLIANIDVERPDQVSYLGDSHALYLFDLKTVSMRKIHRYGRGVTVVWAPDSSALFINERTGSDSSNVFVFLVTGSRKIDVAQELKKKVPNRSILENHHVYVEGVEWAGGQVLKVRVHGYGDRDPNGFELLYEYVVGNGLKRVS